MARWTNGQAETDRFAQNVQTLGAGAGAKGVTVRLKDGTTHHGTVGNVSAENDCASTGLPSPTQYRGTVEIRTASGNIDLDIADIELVMAH